MQQENDVTDLTVGVSAISQFSRLPYTMWYALAEFIDNSTQSRTNYGGIVNDIFKAEGTGLVVDIIHSKTQKTITIEDNSIGMTKDKLIQALKIANPTSDSKGRSKYGMGLKTAACWIGRRWQVVTCEWDSGIEWTADIDVNAIVEGRARVPLTSRPVDKNLHYTRIIISDLNRHIQKRTEDTIRTYFGSMYRFDLSSGVLKLTYNGEAVTSIDKYAIDTDAEGKSMKQEFDVNIEGKKVKGWFGVLRKGSGGRKWAGFSLFQHGRQIQGVPNAWKPSNIFGGVDDEGANNLIAQRLAGVIELDGFEVSHTKDAILFQGNEEEELERYLENATKTYREYAQSRRGDRGQSWSKEKMKDLVESMASEFVNPEIKDAISTVVLPPVETIQANNAKQVASLSVDDRLYTLEVLSDLKVIVSEQERSEHDPYVTIEAGAEKGVIHIIVNGLHPYYSSIYSTEAIEECLRQFIYDAISEFRVTSLQGRVNPDSVRRLKNDLLKAKIVRIENKAATEREAASNVPEASSSSRPTTS